MNKSTPHIRPVHRVLAFACLSVLVLTGCKTAQVTTSLTSQYAGNDMDSQMNFWHSLNDKKLISNDEAFHGSILFYCGKDNAQNYDQRVTRMKQDGFLSPNFDGAENEAVTRGQLAAVLARILKIKGGVMMQLFGPVPRYALKEMVALRIFPQSSTQQVINGAQLIDIIGRAEDYQEKIQRDAEATQLNIAENQPAKPSEATTSHTADTTQTQSETQAQ